MKSNDVWIIELDDGQVAMLSAPKIADEANLLLLCRFVIGW
jgi:hypothetical protein